ncbi:MAG TPA: PEP-CTERM-box response regulator transcription factor [Nitrospirales bacterium]|jgi:two-component system NtrC family response regulator
MGKEKLLVVDDDPEIQDQMKWAFKECYEIHLAAAPEEAVEIVKRERPPLITLDLGLPPDPGTSTVGLALLEELLRLNRFAKIVVLTGQAGRSNALHAIRRGAYDFMEKPIQIQALNVILDRADYLYGLEKENRENPVPWTTRMVQGLMGASPPMQQVFETIKRVAATDLPVLIGGESGVGKELVARAIHHQSPRTDRPFIAINCGAIPDTLLESELFGYEKGAYTGAHHQQKGKLEYANGGTMLLDEIGEMKPELQVKLLRFLQDRRMERVGGREAIELDTRIIAATNLDIQRAMAKGMFRADLYYRLGVVEITVPPLRDREDDAVLLAEVFVERYREELNPQVRRLADEARVAVRRYAWPGNVRELENRIRRALVMAHGPAIKVGDLNLPAVTERVMNLRQAREQLEKELIGQVLLRKNWNITRAAEALGIARETLRESIQRYSLRNGEAVAV